MSEFDEATPVKSGQMMVGRLPPHSIEAEEYLLSCLLLDKGETLAKCIGDRLSPHAFYSPANRLIYDTLRDMHADQKGNDIGVLAEELKTAKLLDSVGGYSYLTQISGRIPTTAQAQYFMDKLRELHKLRELILRGTGLVEACYTYQGDMDQVILPHIEGLNAVVQQVEESRTWAKAVDEAEALTKERMKPPEEREMAGRELSWGLADFNRFFRPIEPGELIVIGGYTSSGKSSLLRQILWSLARSGDPTILETIEVRDSEEAVNLAGHISGLRSRADLDKLHPKDQQQLLKAFGEMRTPKFAVSHADHSLAAMLARVGAFKRKHGLAAWGADYLQIMEDIKLLRPGEREDMAIGRVTSALKRFSTQENVATFLLSGFNRDYIRSESGRDPKLSDLAGSSHIEKDASRVLLLHIPTEYVIGGVKYTQSLTPDADVKRFYVKVIQGKGRNQGTASVGVYFHRESKTFHQIQK